MAEIIPSETAEEFLTNLSDFWMLLSNYFKSFEIMVGEIYEFLCMYFNNFTSILNDAPAISSEF